VSQAGTDENGRCGASALPGVVAALGEECAVCDQTRPLLPGRGAAFRRRSVVLEPGQSRPSGDAEWRDALVIVERGDVELECAAGGRRRFSGGAVLWLEGIDLRVLHNVGDEPVVLLAVSRRRDEEPHGPP